MNVRIAIGLLLAALAGAPAHSDAAKPAPGIDEVVRVLGLTDSEQNRLRSGEIVSRKLPETLDNQLALGVAAVVPLTVDQAYELVRGGMTIEVDPDVETFRDLGGDPRREQFEPIELVESGEIDHLLVATSGSRFNLDDREIRSFHSLRERFPDRGCGSDATCRDAVLTAYRDVLFQRVESYRRQGLRGIRPYSRGSDVEARPATELTNAAEVGEVLGLFPQLRAALMTYPAGEQDGLDHRLYWATERVRGRPTVFLAHTMVGSDAGSRVFVERRFFVGHSYNSLETVVACLPFGDSAVVVYTARAATDQILGFPAVLRRAVARRRLLGVILEEFAGFPRESR